MKNKILKLLLSIIILGIFTYFIVNNVEFTKIKESIIKLNLFWALLSLLLSLFLFIVKAYRWKIILSGVKHIKFRKILGIFSVSQFLTNIFPFRTGDIVQIFTLSINEQISKASILSGMAGYYLMDLFLMIVVFIFISMAVPLPFKASYYIYIIFGILTAFFVLYLIFIKKIEAIIAGYSEYLGKKIALLNEGIKMFSDKRLFILCVSYSLSLWIISYFQALFLLKAFNIDSLSFIAILAYLTIPGILAVIPAAPGAVIVPAGWGILVFFNVEKSVALSVALMSQLIGMFVMTALAVFSILVNKDIKYMPEKNIESEG